MFLEIQSLKPDARVSKTFVLLQSSPLSQPFIRIQQSQGEIVKKMIFSKNLVGGLTVAYVALVGCDHHRNLRIKSKFSGDQMVKRSGHKTG